MIWLWVVLILVAFVLGFGCGLYLGFWACAARVSEDLARLLKK